MAEMASATHKQESEHPEDVPCESTRSQEGTTLSYKELWATFLDSTTAHGLSHLHTEFSIIRKVVWVVVFLSLTILCCYQSYVLVEKYLQYDVNVAVHIINK